MPRRLAQALAVAALFGACTSSSQVSIEADPPIPVTPSGWVLVNGMGSAGVGKSSSDVHFDSRDIALNAACTGSGTLVVLVLPRGAETGTGPGATFRCGGLGATAVNRFEFAGEAIPESATIRVSVEEDSGALRQPAFMLSVEQRQP